MENTNKRQDTTNRMSESEDGGLFGFIIFLICAIVIMIGIYFLIRTTHENSRKEYCGTVTKIYILQAGHKVSAEHRLIFYCPSINRSINLDVTPNCYANAKINGNICFRLSDDQVE